MATITEIKNLIDVTTAATVYGHLQKNDEIDYAIQVSREADLAEVGMNCINGNTEEFERLFISNKISFGITIPVDTYIKVLYLPPAYIYQIE